MSNKTVKRKKLSRPITKAEAETFAAVEREREREREDTHRCQYITTKYTAERPLCTLNM